MTPTSDPRKERLPAGPATGLGPTPAPGMPASGTPPPASPVPGSVGRTGIPTPPPSPPPYLLPTESRPTGASDPDLLKALDRQAIEADPCARPTLPLGPGDPAQYDSRDRVAATIETGDTLCDKYEVMGVLGFGGMGVVYECKDLVENEIVAVKAMLPSLLGNEKVEERFVHEAKIAKKLSHDGIVRVHQLDRDARLGIHLIVMERLQGETLRSRMARAKSEGQRFPPAEALRIFREILEVLQYAHGHAMVHRDLTPENVMLVPPSDRVKILDFGIAKAVADGSHLTQTRAILGKPRYMAPEQEAGGAVDHRADIYAACQILHEMLTGAPALPASEEWPSTVYEDLPREIDDLLRRGLQPKPERRYPDAAAVLRDLDKVRLGAARGRRGFRIALAAGIAGIGIAAVSAILFGRYGGGPRFLALAPPPGVVAVVAQPVVAIAGRLSDPSLGTVRIGVVGEPPGEYRLDESGRFQARVALGPGKARADIEIRAGVPPDEVVAVIPVEVDLLPPEIDLDVPAIWGDRPLLFRYRVRDAHPDRVWIESLVENVPTGPPIEQTVGAAGPEGWVEAMLDPPSRGTVFTVRVEAGDRAGLLGSEEREVAIDRLPPRVFIESPLPGSVTPERIVPVRARVDDDAHPPARATVALSASGAEVRREDVEIIGGRVDIPAFDLSQGDGMYRISVQAVDGASNPAEAAAWVALDTAAPRIVLSSPLVCSVDSVSVRCRVEDPHPSLVTFTLLADGRPLAPVSRPAGGGAVEAALPIPQGARSLRVRATAVDQAGNMAETEWNVGDAAGGPGEVSGTVDVQVPGGTARLRMGPPGGGPAPAEGLVAGGRGLDLRGEGAVGAGAVTVVIRDATREVWRTSTMARPDGSFEIRAADLSLPDGRYTLEVGAPGGSGTVERTSLPITVDRTPPTVDVGGLDAALPVDARAARLTIRTSEPLADLVVNGTRLVSGAAATGPWSVEVPFGEEPEIRLDVSGTDAAGNPFHLAPATLSRGSPTVGWAGESLPAGLRRGPREGTYLWDTGHGLPIEMVYVPSGPFTMGGTEGDEQPAHVRNLPAFYIGRFETTFGTYLEFSRATGRDPPPAPSFGIRADHPVVNVSWAEAAAFCGWAGLRLPTEAEWEKAARGTDGRTHPWGNDPPNPRLAVFQAQGTSPVGAHPDGASPFGAEDMAGNVWEWCADAYVSDAYARFVSPRPEAPASTGERVHRGGGFSGRASHCRSADRMSSAPTFRGPAVGFRPALSAATGR